MSIAVEISIAIRDSASHHRAMPCMVRTFVAITIALLLSSTTEAKPPRITSVYTTVDWKRCKVLEESDEGPYVLQRCPGYAGIPVFVEVQDDRSDVSAGSADGQRCLILLGCVFATEDDTVEWRLGNGKPFAIIYRLHTAWPGDSGKNVESSVLVVETIGSVEQSGCRIAQVPGNQPNANVVARAAADRALSGKPKCLSSH